MSLHESHNSGHGGGFVNRHKEMMGNAPPGGGRATAPATSGKTPAMKIKPGFRTGIPGRGQSKNRSAGVPRAKVYVQSEGL